MRDVPDDGMFTKELDGLIKYKISTGREIGPSKKQELANTYSPVLKFHSEPYYPRDIYGTCSIYRWNCETIPVDIEAFLETSELKDERGNTIIEKPFKEDLSHYSDSDNYLHLRDDWWSTQPDYDIYSHVFTGMNNKIVIQYWFFYKYNEHLSDHRGDWEMIQIILDEDKTPQNVGYSQHYGGDKRSWNSDDVGKVDGTHPEVYVAEGGHASYFESGTTHADDHQGDGTVLDTSAYSIDNINNEDWLKFRGDWGEDSGSVPGPVFRHTKPDASNIRQTPTSYMWVEPIHWNSVIG